MCPGFYFLIILNWIKTENFSKMPIFAIFFPDHGNLKNLPGILIFQNFKNPNSKNLDL